MKGTVIPGAAEGFVLRAVRGALTAKGTFAVVVAFQRHLTFVGKGPVEFDFFADSGLVLTYGLGDDSLSGVIGDFGKYDSSFFQS